MALVPSLVMANPTNNRQQPHLSSTGQHQGIPTDPLLRKRRRVRTLWVARGNAPTQAPWPGDDFPLHPSFRPLPSISSSIAKRSLQLWQAGQVTQAVEYLHKAITALPGAKSEQARLALGHRLMSFEDGTRAVREYRLLLKAKTPAVAWAARLMLARHAWKQYSPKRSHKWLKSWPQKAPKGLDKRIWQAGWLLRGWAAQQTKHPRVAKASFQFLSRHVPALSDFASYSILKAEQKTLPKAALVKRTRAFLKRYSRSRYRSRVQRLQAYTLEQMGKTHTALKMYRVQMQRSKRALLGWVRCLRKLGKKEQAYKALLNALERSPGHWVTHRAYKLLQRHYSSKRNMTLQYAKAYHLFRRGAFKASDQQLKRLHQRARKLLRSGSRRVKRIVHQWRAKGLYLHGRVLFRLKRYKETRRALQTYLSSYPTHRYKLSARLLRIRAQYRARKDLQTVREYERFAQRNKGNSLGRKSLWWSAQLYFEHKQTNKAISLFRTYAKRYPRNRRRAEAIIKVALVSYQKGDYSDVIKTLRPLTRWGGRTGARALFWTAKAQEKKKKYRTARKTFAQIRPFSESYYAAQAQKRLIQRPLLATKALSLYKLLSTAPEEAQHKRSIIRWMKRQYPNQNANKWASRLQQKSAYKRAYLFALAGIGSGLKNEMRRLQRRPEHPFHLYLLARAWQAFGSPNRTLYVAGRFRAKVPRSKRKGLPFRALLRLLYPIPFPAAYMKNGKRYGVRPLLMVALTRQESLFNPTIISHANARGIAQIMPKEAVKMAKDWGLKSYRIEHLFRPQLNLRMGFFHFRAYLKKHSDDVPLTLAAYNAGPNALKRWRKAHKKLLKNDFEAFVEIGIGYRETRTYVRYCLRWYNMYRFAFAAPENKKG